MKKKQIYICNDSSFESVEGAPCIILDSKAGANGSYVEIELLFLGETYLTFKSHLKKATPAMTKALENAYEIYIKTQELKEALNNI
jgi:hypothetical protein